MAAAMVTEDRLTSGHRLSHPPPGDEVLITGISGSFPDSDSVMDLQENLFNKVDLVTADARRWQLLNSEIPARAGKVNNLHKFDASFFGITYKEAHTMDPVGRILLEKTYEAIFDAGVNPNELRDSKTGVFVATSFCESEQKWIREEMQVNGFGLTGCSRAMLANRISYWLGVTGPSYTVDTACSSSLYALEHAFRAIRDGRCDSAIVCGYNLCLYPYNTLEFSRAGVLSHDGICKCFDDCANGYVRSEAIVAVFLQKAKNCRRAYTQLVYAKTSCDGFKEQGIMYPSKEMQTVFFKEFYEECYISPYCLEFFEAHGTGTQVGDRVEMLSINEVFAMGRSDSLKIGTVKSNLGHTEPASGLCAIAKMCIAYSTGYIPPNLNYKTPRKDVEHRLEVVTDKTPWKRGLAGVNGFGFGGANAHVLLKNFADDKVNKGMPFDDLPRLVCVSGRTETAVAKILNELETKTVDIELVRLLHSIHDTNIEGHVVRGYSLLGSTPTKSVSLARDVQYFSGVRRPVWFVYSGMGSQWAGMATELMRIPVFSESIQKCHKVLESEDINLIAILTEPDPKIYDNILNSFIGIAAMQIGLTDVMKTAGIEPYHAIGHDMGKIGCAYANGSLTAEETIRVAYGRGLDCMKFPKKNCSPATPALFDPSQIHHNAITIEFAPHGILKNILRRSLKDGFHLSLMEKTNRNNAQMFFNALGQLYEAGLNPHLANIYPHVPFPVSQGTPMLAHLVEWEHSDDWCVPFFKLQSNEKSGDRTVMISLADQSYEYIAGHCVDGRILFPATGYLVLVWETLGIMMGKLYTEVSVVFENVRFQRATNIPKDSNVEFNITIHKGSGDFEIVESGASIVTGKIYAEESVGQNHRVLESPPVLADAERHTFLTKDFYKEMRLKGHQSSGLFQSVLEWNFENYHGRISWVNNWVTFIDSMLQIKVISYDNRDLFVPTRIEKLSIDVNMHYNATSKMNHNSSNNYLEVRMYPNIDMIRSGGVEVQYLHTTRINKKVALGVPVHEKYEFIVNFGQNIMKINDILRIYIQVILENIPVYNVKGIELADDEYKRNGYKALLGKVNDILGDTPLVRAELLLILEDHIEMCDSITVSKKTLHGESDIAVFIGANLLVRPEVLQQAVVTLRDKSFMISREKERPNPQQYSNKYDIVCIHDTGAEYLVLFRKWVETNPATFIKIVTSDRTYAWIDKVKNVLENGQKVVLYTQDEPVNGLLGLVNCLRKEPGGEKVYGLLISDQSAPAFNPELDFYKKQLDKDLAINIYQDGRWGTYRHLLLGDLETAHARHAYVNTVTTGDLSSLRWLEGNLRENHIFKNPDNILVHVYCAALNFRDIMTASGRLPVVATMARSRLAQECVQGFEIAGKTPDGARVMGMISNSGLANLAVAFKPILMPVPNEWSFEEAASVPVAYSTAYYAMVMVGQMQRGESILIHAGSGGVGQAAINVALHYGCEIFTTVGTAEKRTFIKKLFPQLKDSHIGNSRDTSFENMIKQETNGKGVDLVLNSLSDDKLQASVRCLGSLGRFLEIGQFDISNNTPIGMHPFNKEISFHSIMLNYMIDKFEKKEIQRLQELILAGIASGVVRPLTFCTFEKNEVEAAYRYMAAGKHVGKVIIKIQDEDRDSLSSKPTSMPIEAIPRYICDEDHVYVVVGGLGGFGLELADWLILRGARKIMLSSRRGVINGYQASRLRAWASYGADVQISTENVSTESGCEAVLRAANAMGPVKAIFNLAVILKDALFQNQTPESFKTSFAPKGAATEHLDKLSRKLCPGLKDFVVFSSISCGRGNAGQTNYGFSNSVMEKICERRKNTGLPALAIQWGSIADVGLLVAIQNSANQLEFAGYLQQRISSCLLVLDKLLKQDATIVTSMVVADKKAGGSGFKNIVDAVSRIMGIKDVKTVSQQVTLAELGMDSMTAVEIKQTLEREFEMILTSQDIRTMTFPKSECQKRCFFVHSWPHRDCPYIDIYKHEGR